jgi:ATP-dependent Lon protease
MKREFEDIEDIQQKIQTIPSELPVLPVRDAVIFPHAVIPLTVGREASVKLINEVQQGDGLLVVLTQRDKKVDTPSPSDLYEVGTVSMVHRVMKTPEGNLFVIIMGVARTRIKQFSQFEPYLRASIEPMADEREDEAATDFQALRRTVVSQFERIIKLSPQLPDDLQTIPAGSPTTWQRIFPT